MPPQELAALYTAHRQELELFLFRHVRCRETAADLLQETFLRLAQQSGEADRINIRAYLYRIARNLVIDHVRRINHRQTYPVSHERLAAFADPAASIDRTLDAHRKIEALRSAIDELPARTREVFVLARLEGRTYAEIADTLCISTSSVQKHLAKALVHAMRRVEPNP